MTDAGESNRTGTRSMKDVDHTHPRTNRTFGGNFTFARGGAVAADGGRPDVLPEDGQEVGGEEPRADDDREALRDVEHTPPNGNEDANRVFARGGEDERVVADE